MGLGSGIRDPEKNLFRIPDPGPGSKRHRIPDTDPQYCIYVRNSAYFEYVHIWADARLKIKNGDKQKF